MGHILYVCLTTVLLLTLSEAAVSGATCSTGTKSTACSDIENAECDITDSVCKCSAGFKEDPADKCNAAPGTGCSDTISCVSNANCAGTTCACNSGYKPSEGLCIKVLNSGCDTNNDCPVTNSECQTDVCKCRSGYKESDVECVKEKVSETDCLKDQPNQCTGIDNAECNNDDADAKCECSDGYIEDSGDGSTCVKAVSGTDCTTDGNECASFPNAECDATEKKCRCNPGYVMNVDVCEAENAATNIAFERVTLVLLVFVTVLKRLV